MVWGIRMAVVLPGTPLVMPQQLVRWLDGEVNPDNEDFLVKACIQQECGEHMRGEAVPWFIECSVFTF